MTYEAIAEQAKDLPNEQLAEIENYINFLKFKLQHPEADSHRKTARQLGWFKGALKYMADDFDETPDEFKEYI